MQKKLLILFLIVGKLIVAQSDTVAVLTKKGDGFLLQKNYQQASYYYNLALSFTPVDTSKGSLDNQIKCKIITSDSLYAYSCPNPAFIQLLKNGDSLFACCEIASIRAYDGALKLEKNFDYPANRINEIIEGSPAIQKKLLVIDARRKRHLYESELDLAMIYYNKGDLFKAMRIFERMTAMFKDDTLANNYLDTLKTELKDEIITFEDLIIKGDSLLKLESFSEAKKSFETALIIDKECNYCSIKLKSIDFLIASGRKPKDWGLLREKADANYVIGNYEMAHYQFTWLYKHDVNDLYASKMISKIEKILDEELNEKMVAINAKLLLEQADHEFILGHYSKAKEIYLKIENRYSKATEYLVYVKERILDCQHYLDTGKDY